MVLAKKVSDKIQCKTKIFERNKEEYFTFLKDIQGEDKTFAKFYALNNITWKSSKQQLIETQEKLANSCQREIPVILLPEIPSSRRLKICKDRGF